MNSQPVAAGKSSFDLVDVENVFSILAPRLGSSVLDLACGAGRYSIEMANAVGPNGAVYAIDLWPEGIESLAKEAASRNIDHIETILADITEELPLDDHTIDTCLIATTLHDLTKTGQQSVVKEIVRILKPGATLNIIEFKRIEVGPGPPVDIRMDEKDVDELVTSFGFEKRSYTEVGDYNYLIQYKKATC